MAQALGVRLLRRGGGAIAVPAAGGDLGELEAIDIGGRHAGLAGAGIRVACDVRNPLYGPEGAARVYGPQKGADPPRVEQLDRGLENLARVIRRDLGVDVQSIAGAGAAGGLGAGLVAFCGARLVSGIELILDAVGFAEQAQGADLILTGEGRIDEQTAFGKTIAGVARIAGERGTPLAAFAGLVQEPGKRREELGLVAIREINDEGLSVEQSMAEGPRLLARAAERLAREYAS